jgi:hypothetical protein
MCVQADLSRRLLGQVPWVVESMPLVYKDIQGGFEELWESGAGSVEEPGLHEREDQGCDCLLAPYKVSLSSPEPRDQSGRYSAVAVCRLSKPHS